MSSFHKRSLFAMDLDTRRIFYTTAKVISSFLFGFAAVFTFYYPSYKITLSTLVRDVLLVGVFCLFSGLAYWILYRFGPPRFRQNGITGRGQALILGSFLIAGVLLVMFFPVYPFFPGEQVLEIIATGEKNPASTGNEIHLGGLFSQSGDKQDYARFVKYGKDKWDILDGQLIAKGNLPARAVWKSDWVFPVLLIFYKTDYSGKVTVKWNDKEVKTFDLYSDTPSTQQVSLEPGFPRRYILIEWIVIGIVVGLLLYWITAFLVQPRSLPAAPTSGRHKPWNIAAFALPMIAVWLFYWLALWPGIMTTDSIDQLSQITSGNYSDAHPVILTWTWWLILRVWNSPAAITLFQIIALAGVAGLGYYQMRCLRTRIGWLVVGAGLFALSIVNSLMVVTLWKDLLFSTAFLLFFVFWLDIIVTQGKNFGNPLYFMGFVVVSTLSALYRHNGLPTIFFSILFLVVFMKGIRRNLSISLAIIFAIIMLIKGPVFDRMHVGRAGSFFETVFELYNIGAHIDAGTSFSKSDQEFLNSIHPLEDGWYYSCDTAGYFLNSRKTNLAGAYANQSRLREIFINSFLVAPVVNFNHMFCSSSMVWRIKSPSRFQTADLSLEVLKKTTKNQSWLEWVYERFNSSRTPQQIWYTWRPATYLYLFLFGVSVTAIKKGKRYLLLAVPVIGICLPLLLANHSQSFRYMYPVYLISLLYWPYLLANNVKATEPNVSEQSAQ